MALAAFVLPVLLAFAPQATTLNQEAPSAPAVKEEASYVLGPNDRIMVRCVNADELPPTPIRIDNDGQVTLPFVGRVKLAGLTVSDAEKQLTDQLSKFIRHPQVQLNVVESHSQPVSVFGAVRNPGAYQLEGQKNLTEILSMAGGLRPDAGRILKLTRRAESSPIPLPSAARDSTGNFTVAEVNVEELVRGSNPSSNVEVRPYDVISVPPAELVYVVGQVRKPGGFIMTGREDFTVLQAVSMAEGLDRTAAPKKARIIRKATKSGRIEIQVNLERILSGRDPDMPMQAEDVLFVPNSAAKNAGMKTLDAIIQTATGIAVYGRY
jgi:polysaccharide export outer membrane protein